MEKEKINIFVERLLLWWQQCKQKFPWRGETDPYKILIAEFLLRKTTAKQVASVYGEFLSFFPNPKSLAEASLEKLEMVLRPLGIYKVRARLLKRLGEVLVERFSGQVPREPSDLLLLPGISKYIANAVLCFAYGEKVPLVDTNIVRIFQRVFALKSRKKRARNDPYFWKFAQKILPEKNVKSFNLALIDFAHKICRAKKPLCSTCIMQDICSSPEKKEPPPKQPF